jgi:hypothetical protein
LVSAVGVETSVREEVPEAEIRRVAVRAYTVPPPKKQRKFGTEDYVAPPPDPSDFSLTFDTETTNDAAQQLRFGTYQLRDGDQILEQGFFYHSSLGRRDRATIRAYVEAQAPDRLLEVVDLWEFVHRVFYPAVYENDALCLGFNLPFDISRLATGHGPSKTKGMEGGFNFKLSPYPKWPQVQVRHLTNRAALIQLAAVSSKIQPTGTRRGYFQDVRTLAGALLGDSWSLEGLTKHLSTHHQKSQSDEHGQALTNQYLAYALNDVNATWDCYAALAQTYRSYGLSELMTRIYSEAGLGKAYLKEMGMQHVRNLPPQVVGWIMGSYFGGRAEVRVRRQTARVLYCDFTSMFPTVSVLMGLWGFVKARTIEYEEATASVQEWLDAITVEDLQNPDTWRELTAIVQLKPDGDILPVRAHYSPAVMDDPGERTIGLNYLSSDLPLWYTLADAVASKLLTGTTPRLERAIRFKPGQPQPNLVPVAVLGNGDYVVDPNKEDFFKRLIELRQAVQERAAKATGQEKEVLDAEQQALKICANATAYGIYVEQHVKDHPHLVEIEVFGAEPDSFKVQSLKSEDTGPFFHPLVGTLTTGAARLMLALTERLAADRGLGWVLCDTDSMALARPEGMAEQDFLHPCDEVIDWFAELNPYVDKGPLLKIEKLNRRWNPGTKDVDEEIEELYAWAVSAKRYALFNLHDGQPLLRKVSGHGLGHLLPPYDEKTAPVDVPRLVVDLSEPGSRIQLWQHEVWLRIVQAGLSDSSDVGLWTLDRFSKPRASRYSASSANLLTWFANYNKARPYEERVRPFGFMLAFQTRREQALTLTQPMAPFDRDVEQAARHAFDRATGEPVPAPTLMNYAESVAQYHLHPEDKFLNGDFGDSGLTRRRHIGATQIEYIGKEADRWEEQSALGLDPDAAVVYGLSPRDAERMTQRVMDGIDRWKNKVATKAGVNPSVVHRMRQGQDKRPETLFRLERAILALNAEAEELASAYDNLARIVRESGGVAQAAASLDLDRSNLQAILMGRRKITDGVVEKLRRLALPLDV